MSVQESTIQGEIREETKGALTVCPTCKGKGFLTEMEKLKNLKSHSEPSMPLGLPKIRSPQNRSIRTQLKSSEDVLPVLPSKTLGTVNRQFNRSRRTERLPPIRRRDASATSSEGSFNGEVIPQVEIDDMQEFIRRAKMRMKSGDIEEVSQGVVDVVHIAKENDQFAYPLMPLVNRHLVEMLRSLRVIVLRRACQAISNLFRRMSYITRPEFDEMLLLLLKRTADSKQRVREDASEALNVLVMTSPPTFVIRALCMKGPDSKNPILRVTSAQIISSCVQQVGHDQLLNHPALRDMRKRVLEAGCILLLDPQAQVRSLARGFMTSLRDAEGFDEALEFDAPRHLLKEVERTLIWLRHAPKPPISHTVNET
ncbi:hypothetical protein GE061_008206 [Apolygus lucorum]|uniref:TOG domain-containing protein n=1 Tax=Apolygus lucorum TaxID=248454 RepID=A0A8S9WQP8_APOLU|nr:hypothetical protein GE061_008206 [Apolygus lucorum]